MQSSHNVCFRLKINKKDTRLATKSETHKKRKRTLTHTFTHLTQERHTYKNEGIDKWIRSKSGTKSLNMTMCLLRKKLSRSLLRKYNIFIKECMCVQVCARMNKLLHLKRQKVAFPNRID